MQTNCFKSLVQSTWEYWQQHLDLFPEIDWEETEESMMVMMPDRRKYLFNRHTGMQQLWMASPISGGRHFSLMNQRNLDQRNCSIINPHGQDHTQCLHRSLLSHAGQSSDEPAPAQSQNWAYWTDTRNGDIVESVLNAEFASQWHVVLHLQPFQIAVTDPDSI